MIRSTPIPAPIVTSPSTDTTTSASNNNGVPKKKSSNLPSSLNEATGPTALLNALGGEGNDAQGMDVLSSLLGGTSGLKTLQKSDDTANSAALEKILKVLEKQEAKAVREKQEQTVARPENSRGMLKESGAEIIRFSVNGYNLITKDFNYVSSILARDESFLLTGQRSSMSSGHISVETIYLLCKKTGLNAYQLFVDVSQDVPNENSFIYQLSRKTPLKGTLTGDLLVFRVPDPAWNLNLVIRIINSTVLAPHADK